MNSRLPNPNNHVPETSPDDGWVDPGEARPESVPKRFVLPIRRTAADPSPRRVSQSVGLRIESKSARRESSDIAGRIEVNEIGRSVVRLGEGVPPPPKVERHYTFHEKAAPGESGKNQNGESREWGMVRRHPMLWIVGMGVAMGLLVTFSLMVLPAINAPNVPGKNPVEWALRAEEGEKIEGMEALNLLLTQQPEARQIFRAYAQASVVEEIVPLIKDGKALEETLRSLWDPLKLPSSWDLDEDSSWDIQEFSGQAYAVMEGYLPDKTKFSAYFTRQSNRLVLDWKASVAFGTATFENLVEGKGDTAEIRGEISPADYYSSIWPEAEYRNYRLTSPDRKTSIWCYVRRGEATEAAIAPLFNQGVILGETQATWKITLRLAPGPAESLPNQWLIGEMLHIDWATP